MDSTRKAIVSQKMRTRQCTPPVHQYGTVSTLLEMFAQDGEHRGRAHAAASAELKAGERGPVAILRQWMNETFKSSGQDGAGAVTRLEGMCVEAQKEWARLLGRLESTKKHFYTAVREANVANVNLSHAKLMHSSEEKKLAEKCKKTTKTKTEATEQYTQLIEKLTGMRQKYVDSLLEVLLKTFEFIY